MSGGGEKFVMTSLDEVRFGDPPGPPQAPFAWEAGHLRPAPGSKPYVPFSDAGPDLSGLGDLLNLSRQEVLDALFDAALDSFDLALPDAAFGAPDQPRLPAGQAGGGEWTSGGGPVGADAAHGVSREEYVARSGLPDPVDDLDDVADALRESVEEVAGTPKDMCIAAAMAVRAAYPGAEVWTGTYSGEPHVLARLGGKFLDVTADQFNPAEAEVQVLDPGDLPREYRRYKKEFENVLPGYEKWPHAREVAADFLLRLREVRARRAGAEHESAVRGAVRRGAPVPAHARAAYPDLAGSAPFYSPDQPRVPAGQPGGGEWGSGGGGGASVRPAALEDYARAVESWKQDRALWTFTPNFGFQNVHFAWDGAGKLTGWVGWDVSPAGALNFAIDTRRDVRSPALAGRLLRAFLSSPDRARVTSIEAVAVTDAGQRMVESLAKRLGVPWTGERRTESATAGGPPAVVPAEAPERVPGRLAALAGRLRGFFGGGEAQFSWDAWAALDGPAGEAAFALAEDAPFYSPDQPRVPAGQPGGGRWAGGVSPGTTAARDAASDAVRAFARGRGPATAREAHALAGHLAKLTVSQIHALKAQHGLKGSAPNKAALVAKLAQRFRDARAAAAPAPAPVALTHAQWVAAGQPLPLLYQAWLAAGQPPATQAFPIPPALLPPTPPPPAPAPARVPAFVPGPQGPVPNPVLNRGANVITGVPAKAAVPAVPFAAERAWETGKPEPGVLNGIPFAPAPPKFWEKAKDVDVGEPPPARPVNRAGVLIQEADGRIWIVQPTNAFGNRNHTLPGGGVEPGLSVQQNALKEVWEETGLQVEITGYAGDFEDSNNGNNGRLYLGRRVGGAPWDAKVESFIVSNKTGNPAAESETVTLVTPERAAQLLHRTDDLAQLMVAHPPPVDTPTRGKGSEPLKKLLAAVGPAAREYERKRKAAGAYPGNAEMHAVQELRGFNAKPKVVSKADFDALVAKGDHVEVLRGVKDHGYGASRVTGKQLADQYREGEHFPGHGIFGSGTYTDSTRGHGNVAAGYAGRYGGGGGEVLRMALPKDAKIIKESELEKAVPQSPAAFAGYQASGGKLPRECWLGVQAALAGYDAIAVDGKSAYHGSYGDGFYVILNRSVVTVQDKAPPAGYVIP